MDKKAILVVSFGTSYPEALCNNIERVEKRIGAQLEEYELRRAFTSEIIIKKLKRRDGVTVLTPQQALEAMKDEGFTQVVIQPLHVLPGSEYHEVKEAVEVCKKENAFEKISLGEPLLYTQEDYAQVVEALKRQISPQKDGQAVVLMGHGTEHFSNACYYCLQSFMDRAGMNAWIATVEGLPELKDIIPVLKEKGVEQVTLMPFMLVAGDHAINDMAGEEDSWKQVLQEEGFEVEVYLHGLGENTAIQEIYTRKALQAEQELKSCK